MSDTSIWTPLRNPVFRRLWLANVISGACVSAHDTAATWVMHTVTPSSFMISLMSTVASLPFFFFTLPAGAIADMVNRKRLLCTMNIWMATCAAAVAVLAAARLLNPPIILTSVFLFGVGFAFISPAWISIIPEIVSKQDLASAVTLGGLQLNICGIVGPAMGALLLSHFGPPIVFGLNSVCFMVVLAALLLWPRGAIQSKLPLENFFESLTGAIRYVRYAPGIQVVLARNALFSLFISAIPALLPVVGLKELKMNSSDLGLLFTSMGIGSVFSGIVLIPRARARFSPNTLTIIASLLLVAVFVMMALVREIGFFMVVSAMAGVAWTIAAAELWVAGQRAMPPWARGRMNATHIMVSQGAMALGALVWGASAASLGPSFALGLAASLLLASLFLALRLSIDFAEKMNFDPGRLTNRYHAALQAPQPDDGPVSITIEFRIDPSNRAKFLRLMREVRLMHLRNGAYSWRLDEDLTDPNAFRLEMLVASWSEHLLQHERITKSEQGFLEQAWLLDTQEGGPVVNHHLSVNKEVLGGKRIEIPAGEVRHSELQFRDA